MKQVSEWFLQGIANLAVWAGSDNYRWKMKKVGWTGWSVSGVDKEPEPEAGYEKEPE